MQIVNISSKVRKVNEIYDHGKMLIKVHEILYRKRLILNFRNVTGSTDHSGNSINRMLES